MPDPGKKGRGSPRWALVAGCKPASNLTLDRLRCSVRGLPLHGFNWKPWQLRPYVEVMDETIKSSKKSYKVILEKTIPPIQKVLENNKNSIGESLIKFDGIRWKRPKLAP